MDHDAPDRKIRVNATDDGFGGSNSVLDVQPQLEIVPPRSLRASTCRAQ